MRRFHFAAVALLLAGPAFAQLPVRVPPIPFKPYVPPVHCAGRVGRDYINCVIPDNRELAAASFYNTAFEPIYNRLYGPRRRTSADAAPKLLPPSRPPVDPARAVVTLELPEIAEVWVEGKKLTQPGATRRFVSPPLKAGQDYEYAVRVRWFDGKKEQERTLQVPVRAGESPVVVVLSPAG